MKVPGGFVVIQRSLYEHPIFANLGEAMVFAWMISQAAWKPVRVRYKDRPVYLERGQLAMSVRDMARAIDRPKSWTTRFLNRLKIGTLIETQVGTGVNIITICNYSKYQGMPTKVGTDNGTGRGTGPGQGRDTEQQIEQVEQDSLVGFQPTKPGSRSFLPSDWKPPAVAELPPKAQECARQWPPSLYEREAEEFALYWHSEGKAKKDWRATWAGRIIRRHWAIMQEARADERNRSTGDKPFYQVLAERRH